MGQQSKIEWTDATWNPVRGCSVLSPGCTNCYAMKQAHRFAGPGKPYAGLTKMTRGGPVWTGEVAEIWEGLDQPMRWQRPRRVFVNSMSDLFHERVSVDFIAHVFAYMAYAPQHTFQVLTKRAERMHQVLTSDEFDERYHDATLIARTEAEEIFGARGWFDPNERRTNDIRALDPALPLANLHLGVSAEDQRRADERIAPLLATPAARRLISLEPLLGPVHLSNVYIGPDSALHRAWGFPQQVDHINALHAANRARIDWVIVGGESGPGARPVHPGWVRWVRDECVADGVPFLFKQWGEWAPHAPIPGFDEGGALRDGSVRYLEGDGREPDGHFRRGDAAVRRVGKAAAGRLLDGVLHNEFPS